VKISQKCKMGRGSIRIAILLVHGSNAGHRNGVLGTSNVNHLGGRIGLCGNLQNALKFVWPRAGQVDDFTVPMEWDFEEWVR
jgi:hypothetical protein